MSEGRHSYEPVESECPGGAVTAEELARFFHENYEQLAPHLGYKTREASAVPWDDVPGPNRLLMVTVCYRVLEHFFPEHILIQ